MPTPPTRKTDAAWVRYWCYVNDGTCTDLARHLDAHKSTVSRWKNRTRTMDPDYRAAFRALLNVSERVYAKGPPRGR